MLEPSRPRGKEYVRFAGNSFLVDPRELICTECVPTRTLPRLIAAARVYAGPEKIGVHAIAAANPTVVDVEIAFGESGTPDADPSALRIDLAALHPHGGTRAALVFYEATRTATHSARCRRDAGLPS